MPSRRTSSSRTRMRFQIRRGTLSPPPCPIGRAAKCACPPVPPAHRPRRSFFGKAPRRWPFLPTPRLADEHGVIFSSAALKCAVRGRSLVPPDHGSSLPSRAIAVKSRVNSASVLPLLPSLRARAHLGQRRLRGEALIAHSVSLYSFRVSTPGKAQQTHRRIRLSRRIPSSKCPASITPPPARTASPRQAPPRRARVRREPLYRRFLRRAAPELFGSSFSRIAFS